MSSFILPSNFNPMPSNASLSHSSSTKWSSNSSVGRFSMCRVWRSRVQRGLSCLPGLRVSELSHPKGIRYRIPKPPMAAELRLLVRLASLGERFCTCVGNDADGHQPTVDRLRKVHLQINKTFYYKTNTSFQTSPLPSFSLAYCQSNIPPDR